MAYYTSIECAMLRHCSMPGMSNWITRISLHLMVIVPEDPDILQRHAHEYDLEQCRFGDCCEADRRDMKLKQTRLSHGGGFLLLTAMAHMCKVWEAVSSKATESELMWKGLRQKGVAAILSKFPSLATNSRQWATMSNLSPWPALEKKPE